jgi:hypothetical protein
VTLGLGNFVGYCWGGYQSKNKSCTRLAVREATFLMVGSRKSIDAGKNETSRTTENITIKNQIIDRAFIILPWCLVRSAYSAPETIDSSFFFARY